MSQDESLLPPCRCCGGEPEFLKYRAVCKNCNFTVTHYKLEDSAFCWNSDYIRPQIIDLWIKRNAQHNPFMEKEMNQNEIDTLIKGLLPCPFCGGEPGIVEGIERESEYYAINCVDCLASTNLLTAQHIGITFEDAKEAWNARNTQHNPFLEKDNGSN